MMPNWMCRQVTILKMELLLYMTSGCHLCDKATALLEDSGNHTWREVDIADNENLITRYGTRIPVVLRPNGCEIGWPFGRDELEDFLKQ
jgi:hypothetical protein